MAKLHHDNGKDDFMDTKKDKPSIRFVRSIILLLLIIVTIIWGMDSKYFTFYTFIVAYYYVGRHSKLKSISHYNESMDEMIATKKNNPDLLEQQRAAMNKERRRFLNTRILWNAPHVVFHSLTMYFVLHMDILIAQGIYFTMMIATYHLIDNKVHNEIYVSFEKYRELNNKTP